MNFPLEITKSQSLSVKTNTNLTPKKQCNKHNLPSLSNQQCLKTNTTSNLTPQILTTNQSSNISKGNILKTKK